MRRIYRCAQLASTTRPEDFLVQLKEGVRLPLPREVFGCEKLKNCLHSQQHFVELIIAEFRKEPVSEPIAIKRRTCRRRLPTWRAPSLPLLAVRANNSAAAA